MNSSEYFYDIEAKKVEPKIEGQKPSRKRKNNSGNMAGT